MRHTFGRAVYGLVTGFGLVILCWVGWGLATPGDLFGNGSPWVMPSLVASALAGFVLGCTQKAKGFRIAVVALAVAAGVFAPHGWWGHGPPR